MGKYFQEDNAFIKEKMVKTLSCLEDLENVHNCWYYVEFEEIGLEQIYMMFIEWFLLWYNKPVEFMSNEVVIKLGMSIVIQGALADSGICHCYSLTWTIIMKQMEFCS